MRNLESRRFTLSEVTIIGQVARTYLNGEKSIYSIAHDVASMSRDAASLQSIAIRQCNGYVSDRGVRGEVSEQRDLKRETKLEARIAETAKSIGCVPYFQGDPRGPVVRISLAIDNREDQGWAL